MRLDVILAARYLLTIVRRVALNDYAMCWVVGAFHMMVKEERRKFKGQNGSRYEAAGSTQLLPKAATVSRTIGCSIRAVVLQCLLFAIFLLLLAPGLSSAALPSVKTLSPITDYLTLPSGIALGDDEKIYVASSNENQLHVFSKAGQHQGFITELAEPTAVAVDNVGRIYIGNKGTGNVEVYSPDFSPIGELGQGDGEFKNPVGIAVDSAGLIYVVDRREHKVKIYNSDHSFKYSFGGQGADDGQFQSPSSIVINEITSEILIPDLALDRGAARVQVFDLSGMFLGSFRTMGANEIPFPQPTGIAVDTLGRIYVTDAQQNAVMVYDTQGNYLGGLDSGTRALRTPQGLAFAPATSRLFVASQNTDTVETFGIDGFYGQIAASPQSHSFADVAVNDASPSQSFELSNNGNGNLAVGNATLTGADASEFSIISNNCSDQTLAPTAECAIAVQFKPASVGSKSALLTIASDDLYVPTLEVALSGNAAPQYVLKGGNGSGPVQALDSTTHTITATAGANGSISPVGAVAYDVGSTVTFDITADSDYRISDVQVDGVSVGAMESYSFEDLSANHEIAADFVAADSFSLASIETGEVSVNHEWKQINFSKTFENPVVVVKPASRNDASPAAVRVRNVDAQGFEVRIQEWGYLSSSLNDTTEHAEEQVGYIVMEEGGYTLKDGKRIEAGQFNRAATSSFEAINFNQSFAMVPVVMTSVVTHNEEFEDEDEDGFVDGYTPVIGRMDNIDVTGFGYRLQEEQTNNASHGVETVSFIAWEPSQGSQDGISFEVGAISGAETHQTVAVEFNGNYLTQPLLIADLQTTNASADKPPAVNLRWSDKSTTGVDILLDQELSQYALNHISEEELPPPAEDDLASSTEDLGYLVLLPVSHTLTVEKNGLGSGLVQAEGIDCGADCSEGYDPGASVTLSAVAAGGSVFVGWIGGGCSGTADCVVTMNQTTAVTAIFNLVEPPLFTLTAAKDGSGNGQVQSTMDIDCGADCSEGYSNGAIAILYAEAADGSIFTGWSGGGCSGTSSCVVTMDQTTIVTANFTAIHTLTVAKAGSGSGQVQVDGADCGAGCSGDYSEGDSVTLSAEAAENSVFAGWSGGGCSDTGDCIVIMDEATTVTATFNAVYTLTVVKDGSGSGQIQMEGVDCGVDCSEDYIDGDLVTLSADAADGSVFAGWSGGDCSGTTDCVVTMNEATEVTATFNAVYTLTVLKDGSGSGQVQIEGIDCGAECSEDYSNADLITLSAVAADGSVFTGWFGGGCSNATNCVVTMDQAAEVTATFDIAYSITASAGNGGGISPAGTVIAGEGSAVNFNITAAAGYRISDVQVDGVSIGAEDSYRFLNLDDDHEITADFVIVDTFWRSSIEMGKVSVGDEWKRVELSNTFENPVVVVKTASRNDVSPAVVRVRDVDAQGFEVRIQEWDYLDDKHAEEQVGYVVMEKGSYTLGDGTRVEAGQFNTDILSASFTQPFAVAPVVMSSVVTYNDETPVVVRMKNVGVTGFDYQLQEETQNNWIGVHAAETISFIAWEPSEGYQNRLDYKVGRVDGAVPPQTTLIEFTYVPSLFMADLQTIKGSVANLRWDRGSDTDTGYSVLIDPEKSDLGSVSSSSEEIGYLLLKLDSDCDGLSDWDEDNIYTTDPLKADTDGDGMKDGNEVWFWIGTHWKDDPDEDGLINLRDIDSNNDGYRDRSYTPVGDGMPTEVSVTCKASTAITERDGLRGDGIGGEGGSGFSGSDDNKPRMGSARDEATFDQRPGFTAPSVGFGRNGIQVERPNVGFDRSGARFDN